MLFASLFDDFNFLIFQKMNSHFQKSRILILYLDRSIRSEVANFINQGQKLRPPEKKYPFFDSPCICRQNIAKSKQAKLSLINKPVSFITFFYQH